MHFCMCVNNVRPIHVTHTFACIFCRSHRTTIPPHAESLSYIRIEYSQFSANTPAKTLNPSTRACALYYTTIVPGIYQCCASYLCCTLAHLTYLYCLPHSPGPRIAEFATNRVKPLLTQGTGVGSLGPGNDASETERVCAGLREHATRETPEQKPLIAYRLQANT